MFPARYFAPGVFAPRFWPPGAGMTPAVLFAVDMLGRERPATLVAGETIVPLGGAVGPSSMAASKRPAAFRGRLRDSVLRGQAGDTALTGEDAADDLTAEDAIVNLTGKD